MNRSHQVGATLVNTPCLPHHLAPLLLALVLGCASGELGGEPSTPSPDAPAELGPDTPDLPRDQPGEADAQEDLPTDPCDVCCPGDKRCGSADTVQVCREDGSGYDTTPCPAPQVCEAAACVAPRVCEDGESSCLDGQTRLVCRPGGAGFSQSACGAQESCVRGECRAGASAGAACADHDECAGGKCHCGAETAEGCAALFAPAYCAAPCERSSDCNDNEVCLDATVHRQGSQLANYNHCVTRCQGSCTLAGLSCKTIPTRDAGGSLAWEGACMPPGLRQIGETCVGDQECLGGHCLRGYYEMGHCVHRCDSTSCPAGSACVELTQGNYYCSLLCGDGNPIGADPCPLDVPVDRRDVICAPMFTRQGSAVRTCTRPG